MLRKAYQLEKYQNLKKTDASCMTENETIIQNDEEKQVGGNKLQVSVSSKLPNSRKESGLLTTKSLQQYQLAISHETVTQLEVKIYSILKYLNMYTCINDLIKFFRSFPTYSK